MDSKVKKLAKKRIDWHASGVILMAVLAGFLGGIAANKLDSAETVLQDPVTRQQVVSSESQLIADIATQVGASVVSINVQTTTNSFFFGSFNEEGAGTGVIVTADGLVLTNRHVIPENATSVQVILSDGTIYDDVTVVDRDTLNDIAFLRINDVNELTPAVLGDSDVMRVGDKVVAIGNALGEFSNTVTTGIISGQGRPIVAGDGFDSEQLQNLFQTDAAINPGNSGGPLVNLSGEVIGINTAVAGGAENIGFAIPINDVKQLVASVLSEGKIVRPYLGVRYITLTPAIAAELDLEQTSGAYLLGNRTARAVLSGSPADKAGLKSEDIIVSVGEHTITAERPLASAMNKFAVGDSVVLEVVRDGETLKITVVLEAVPESF